MDVDNVDETPCARNGQADDSPSVLSSIASIASSLPSTVTDCTSTTVDAIFLPFFPTYSTPKDAQTTMPLRPAEVTAFGSAYLTNPLLGHEDGQFGQCYPDEYLESGAATIPTYTTSTDPYLFPRLAKNEVQRLTALWFYTSRIQHDNDLLFHLQQSVDLVHDLMGKDCTILGLMDHDYYTRIVTRGCPLAILPRREATCAHTINQPPGTIFMLPNMQLDWRFKESPHVKAGLHFYAGTQLRYKAAADVEVVFGSICVASYGPTEDLTKQQQKTMSKFADIIVHTIIERAELHRATEKEALSLKAAQLASTVNADNVMDVVLDAVREVYPLANVSYQIRTDGMLEMKYGRPILYDNFTNHLYEDTAAIHENVTRFNHIPWSNDMKHKKTLRAIASKMTSIESSYLVVESYDMKRVFDDIDASFVGSCAMTVCNVLQGQFLKRALEAKTQFMRGVSHELRTPIHGILSTCELMLEETSKTSELDVLDKVKGMLRMVDASGRDLLTTVNNLLDFDRLEGKDKLRLKKTLVSLDSIEQDVLDALNVPSAKPNLQLIADNQTPAEVDLVITDFDLLKQCLISLLQNSINFTESGQVILRTNLSEDFSCLEYEILDTGIGIAPDDAERIFSPFEKVDPYSRGPGLGLAIASKIAHALSGSLILKHSELGVGSHFRLRVPTPTLACSLVSSRTKLRGGKMPMMYHMPISKELETLPLTYAARNLESMGCTETDRLHATLDIVEANGITTDSLVEVLSDVAGRKQVAIYITADSEDNENVKIAAEGKHFEQRIIRVGTPIYRARLWRALTKAADTFDHLHLGSRLTDKLKTNEVEEVSLVDLSKSKSLEQEKEKEKEKGVEPPSTKRSRDKLKVLLVDDNKTNLGILVMYCKKRKFSYLTAVDGRQAVELFTATGDISLVLMDLQMPVMDGVEATEEIRKWEEAQGRGEGMCLLYMVTGQSTDEDKRRSVEAGASGYYVKPVSIRSLDDLIGLHFPL